MRRRIAVYVRRNAKQVAWHVAIGVGLFFAVRLVWGWEADREYARLAQEIESKGVSLDMTPRAPDPNNPATVLLHAAGSMSRLTTADRDLIDDGDVPYDPRVGGPQWSKDGEAKARTILAGLGSAFAEMDAAEALKEKPLLFDPSLLSPIRDLADAMRADALFLHQDHHDAQALHRVEQILTVSRVMDGDHTVIGHMVAIALRSVAAECAERLEPDLRLSGDAAFADAGFLVQTLADRAALQESGSQAILSEVILLRRQFEGPGSAFHGWWIRPLPVSFLDRTMDENLAMAPFWSGSDWRGVQSTYTKRHPAAPGTDLLDGFTYDYIYTPLDRAVLMQCRSISDSAAAAMLLAADMYKQRHGQYPVTDVEMVPEFLATVPVDPFDPAGGAMRYRLDADGPTVWSVGENGTDERAAIRFTGGVRAQRYGDSPNDQPDMIYGAAWRDAAAGPPTAK